jgi:hypothetical protein
MSIRSRLVGLAGSADCFCSARATEMRADSHLPPHAHVSKCCAKPTQHVPSHHGLPTGPSALHAPRPGPPGAHPHALLDRSRCSAWCYAWVCSRRRPHGLGSTCCCARTRRRAWRRRHNRMWRPSVSTPWQCLRVGHSAGSLCSRAMFCVIVHVLLAGSWRHIHFRRRRESSTRPGMCLDTFLNHHRSQRGRGTRRRRPAHPHGRVREMLVSIIK